MEEKQTLSAYLECGKIINTHGVRGDVKLESYCDSPEILRDLKRIYFKEQNAFREVRVLHASVFKAFVLMSLEGIGDFDAAVLLKNKIVYAAREDLPIEEGSYFIVDLIGLPVIDNKDGKVYGKITDVINRGASDIYVVKTPSGERMMPVVEEFVKRVDIESGVYVEPIPGLLSDD